MASRFRHRMAPVYSCLAEGTSLGRHCSRYSSMGLAQRYCTIQGPPDPADSYMFRRSPMACIPRP
jgi:hypothetical protein